MKDSLYFIETHAHLDDQAFDGDREAILQRTLDAGIKTIISIGSGNEWNSAVNAIALAEQHEYIFATAGIHPLDAALKEDSSRLQKLIEHPRVVAVGETGLDFYWDRVPREQQESWFRAQISLALQAQKPLIIHSRDASLECLEILEEMGAGQVGGVFHCYAEDAAFAERLWEIKFYVSFPGVLTFKNAGSTRQAAAEIPLERILLETDSPYLAPEPYRGKRCEVSYMIETAKKLAEVKNISLAEVAEQTTKNARQLFQLG